ncbi:GntG family PLP-dependent aldolase [soil metagenome]
MDKQPIIDLRSDTVTQPTAGMRDAMNSAPLGDDVFGEDPTVNALEERLAAMFGYEAGLFCPSGTMTNQIAIKAHTQPLQEIICHRESHIYCYEGGGLAFNSQLSTRLLAGNRGIITAQQVLDNINEENVHKPVTSIVAQENTSNREGGAVHRVGEYEQVDAVCKQYGLKHHLDGARLFNALVATGDTPSSYGKAFDSISICLSKGLGAPVGSVLVGNKEFIKLSRRIRKVFGGGMRQAGVIAAAGLYALDNHIDRIADDHHLAKKLEAVLRSQSYIAEVFPVDSNLVIFRLADDMLANTFINKLHAQGIIAINMGPQLVRFVTHLDVSDSDIDKVCEVLDRI